MPFRDIAGLELDLTRGLTVGSGQADEQAEVARITQELKKLSAGAGVTVCITPNSLSSIWPDSINKPVRIAASARKHYLSHLWIEQHEDEVVQTLRDPDRIRRDAKKPNSKAVFYRKSGDNRHVLVVVERKPGEALSNSVVTAFDVLPMEVSRREKLEILVWGNDG